MKKTFAVLSCAAFAALIVVACNDPGPTSPTTSRVPATVPGAAAPARAPAAPEATPQPELPLSVSCNKATGICTFGTDKPRPVSAVCTAPGQHNDWGAWSAVVNDGDTVNALDICDPSKIPGVDEERCVPLTQGVQIDFQGMGRHIGHLGPLWLMTFPANLSEKECEDCEETNEPKTIPQEPVWEDQIRRGACEPEVLPWPTEVTANRVAPACHLVGSQDIVVDWLCREDGKRTLNLCKNVPCPCVEEWIAEEPIETPGEWGDCGELDARDGCERERTVHVVLYEVNSCTEERRIKREGDRTEREACDCPVVGLCYYRVSCGEQSPIATSTRECTDQAQQSICEAAVGLAGDNGIWRNFGDAQLLNHCQFNLLGYSDNDFQLNPGQSHQDCVNKNDD